MCRRGVVSIWRWGGVVFHRGQARSYFWTASEKLDTNPSLGGQSIFSGGLGPACLAVLGVFGVHFGVAFVNALELFFGQRQFLCGVAQQHQAAYDGAKGNHQDQPGIPRHGVLLVQCWV